MSGKLLYHSDQPGLSLSPGGPPAGFLAGVVGHWGVRRQPGSVIGKVWFNSAANAMRQGVVPIRAAARRHLSPSSGLSPLSLVLIFSDFCHRPTPRRVGRNGTVFRPGTSTNPNQGFWTKFRDPSNCWLVVTLSL